METTPANPHLRMPAHPGAPILNGTNSASAPTFPPHLLYANFAAANLLHTRPPKASARIRLAPALTFPRLLTRSLALWRRAFEISRRALLHCARRTRKSLLIAETASLGDRRLVAVVEVDRQRFLIGAGPSQVTLLATLPDALAAESACQETNRAETGPCSVPATAGVTKGVGQ